MDDAAVVRLPGGNTLIYTIDVLTPIVDDPATFGEIAAVNAISDVYAMGGTPQVALAFVGFPSDSLGLDPLAAVMAGLSKGATRAGCAIVGGHTICDTEPKAGLAVIGTVDRHPWTHTRAAAGDVLILTKPLGTGIIGQAIRAGRAGLAITNAAVESMLRLNDAARDVGIAFGAHAATDITGFGLLGHLKHMLEASNLSAIIHHTAAPVLPGVEELIEGGLVPGGTKRNQEYVKSILHPAVQIDAAVLTVLCDAQTSGGLLLAMPADAAGEALHALHSKGVAQATILGELVDGPPRITVR